MRRPFAIGLLVMMTALPTFVTGQVFRWVDDQGVTHFSTSPPPDNKTAQPVDLNAAPVNSEQPISPLVPISSEKAETDNRQAAAVAEVKAQKEKELAELKGKCPSMRKSLAQLQLYPRTRVSAPDNTIRRLTPEELAKQIDTYQKAIKERCEPEGL